MFIIPLYLSAFICVHLRVSPFSSAQPKQPEKKPLPQILVAAPLGVAAGQTTKVTLRGLLFDGLTEVRCHHPKVQVKLLGPPKKVSVPMDMVATLGDATVDVEVTAPADDLPEFVTLAVITPTGESGAYKLPIDDETVTVEKEPNDGFRQAQPLALPATVAGAIQVPQDVDVFRFEGQVGQRIVCEVLANRLGSPLDASLTLYDAAGVALITADDSPGSRDPILNFTLPAKGTYYLALIDADDRGGPTHVYRLMIRSQP